MNTLTDTRWDSAAEGALARMGTAWHWLCEQRRGAPTDADVWDIRWQVLHTGPHWLPDLVSRVLAGGYRLSPMQLHGRGEHRRAVWGAQDALVLKWVALTLQQWLPLHPACEHVAGHGGGQASVEKLHRLLTQGETLLPGDEQKKTDVDSDTNIPPTPYTWVCRTDIRGYYRHINKQTLLNQVKQHVSSPVLQDLVNQYLHYTVEDGGTFHTPTQGISRGCPLSPLMGALHLHDLDKHFAQQKGIHYARDMDDVIILAKSRWSLRKHTKRLKQGFREKGFEAHPDKTFIGKTQKGFDWMGAWLTPAGVTDIAPRAKANHREKVRRLYERVARWPRWKRKGAKQQANRAASTTRKRWTIWAAALLAVAGTTTVANNARADAIIVLPSGNVPGPLGTTFNLNLGATETIKAGASNNAGGGICVANAATACNARQNPPAWVPVSLPDGTLGITYGQGGPVGLAIVLHGVISSTCSACRGDWPKSIDLVTGNAVALDGTSFQACSRDTNPGALTYYTAGYSTGCGTNALGGVADYPGKSTNSIALNGYESFYALGVLQPWDGNLIALNTEFSRSGTSTGAPQVPLPLPTIIISGLNCNLATGAGIGSGGAISSSSPPVVPSTTSAGTSAAVANFSLQTTCSGTNSTNAAATVNMGATFLPASGSTATDYKLSKAGAPGYYATVNTGATSSCSSGIPFDGSTPSNITTYKPGETGRSNTANYNIALCGTGQSQTPGNYTLNFTATLVNY